MQASLNAIRWGLPRLGLVLALLVLIPVFLYAILVTVIVVNQAITGQ